MSSKIYLPPRTTCVSFLLDKHCPTPRRFPQSTFTANCKTSLVVTAVKEQCLLCCAAFWILCVNIIPYYSDIVSLSLCVLHLRKKKKNYFAYRYWNDTQTFVHHQFFIENANENSYNLSFYVLYYCLFSIFNNIDVFFQAKSRVKEVYAQTCMLLGQQGMRDCELFGLAILSGE